MTLLLIALAPIAILAFYLYFADKHEKEPLGILVKALIAGALTVIPVLLVDSGLEFFTPSDPNLKVFWNAFIIAALVEEAFKFLALYLITWKNRNFNERFDGIIYAVYVSLGFALIENILYVLQGGLSVGILRALTAVPAHALFGISMGFHYGIAKFEPSKKQAQMFFAFTIPFILHGLYDYILMSENTILLILFIPFVVFMWVFSIKRMRRHSKDSEFLKQPENTSVDTTNTPQV